MPTNSRAHHTYARAIGFGMQTGGQLAALTRLGAYKRELQTAIDLDPRNAAARKEQILALSFAPAPVGDAERAVELSRELIEIDPELGAECLARSLARSGRVDEAVRVCRQAIAAHPQSLELHWVLGGILESDEQREAAEAEYAAAMDGEKQETYYQALLRRAKLRIEGSFGLAPALELLDEYLAASPYWEWVRPEKEALLWRGRAFELLGHPALARADYEDALELDPDYRAARDRLEKLE